MMISLIINIDKSIDDDQSARLRSSKIQKATTSQRAEVGGLSGASGLKGLRPETTQKPALLSHYLKKAG